MTEALRRADPFIVEIDPADETAVQASYNILALARAHDVPDLPPPCSFAHRESMRTPWPGHRMRRCLAWNGPHAVGYLAIELPTLDNLDNAYIELAVPPQYRRRGVGRALYEFAVGLVRSEGRKRIMADTVTTLDGGPPRDEAGSGFAAAVGAADANHEVRRRLDLSTVDWSDLDRLSARALDRAAGYSLVQWDDSAPAEYVDDVALLDSRLIEDAPMGDLAWEPEKVDDERVRAVEATRRVYRTRDFTTGMRHDATGRLVAITALTKEHTIADHLWQQITLVHPGHRGHRLGTIVKIENLRYASAALPGIRHIDTWNAEVNDYMISINEAMGFRPVDLWISWQHEL